MLAQNFGLLNAAKVRKHSLPDECSPELSGVLVCLVEKSLDNWLWSIDRYPADLPDKRPQYFWHTMPDHVKLTALHTRFYAEWRKVLGEYEPVQYEDVLDNPIRWLKRMAAKYRLRLPDVDWNLASGDGRWVSSRKDRYLETYASHN
jgi:hypothetical protein